MKGSITGHQVCICKSFEDDEIACLTSLILNESRIFPEFGQG